MPEILSLPDAERLAERTLEAIDRSSEDGRFETQDEAADRQRVASDLAGLRQHREDYAICLGCQNACECEDMTQTVGDCSCSTHKDFPCPDARRYSDNLRRTAALYGVESA